MALGTLFHQPNTRLAVTVCSWCFRKLCFSLSKLYRGRRQKNHVCAFCLSKLGSKSWKGTNRAPARWYLNCVCLSRSSRKQLKVKAHDLYRARVEITPAEADGCSIKSLQRIELLSANRYHPRLIHFRAIVRRGKSLLPCAWESDGLQFFVGMNLRNVLEKRLSDSFEFKYNFVKRLD